MFRMIARARDPAAALLDPVLVRLRLRRREADMVKDEHWPLPQLSDLVDQARGRAEAPPRARRSKRFLDRLDVDRLIVGRDRKPCRVRLDLGGVKSVGLVDQVVLA